MARIRIDYQSNGRRSSSPVRHLKRLIAPPQPTKSWHWLFLERLLRWHSDRANSLTHARRFDMTDSSALLQVAEDLKNCRGINFKAKPVILERPLVWLAPANADAHILAPGDFSSHGVTTRFSICCHNELAASHGINWDGPAPCLSITKLQVEHQRDTARQIRTHSLVTCVESEPSNAAGQTSAGAPI